jgi:hypothetical protein
VAAEGCPTRAITLEGVAGSNGPTPVGPVHEAVDDKRANP